MSAQLLLFRPPPASCWACDGPDGLAEREGMCARCWAAWPATVALVEAMWAHEGLATRGAPA